MADTRKQTPDILGSLLGETKEPAGSQDDSKPLSQPDSTPAKQQRRKTAGQPDSKPAKKATPKPTPAPATGEKVKATLYFAPESIEALEESWLLLRRLADKDQRASISKSSIVEAALQIALEELQEQGEKSQLAKKLV